MDKIPQNFFEAIQSKECILFIGSGISTWSGLPSWRKLIEKMISFLEKQGCSSNERQQIEQILNKDLIAAASISCSLIRKANFREFLDEVFIKPKPKPHEIHEIIVTLGPNCFITTNYDHLIDEAYQKTHDGNSLSVVNNDQPIEHAKIQKYGAEEFLFTPHGRIERIETIIFTKNDYRRLKNSLKSTIDTLNHLFISRPVIYLGFSLYDPDFVALKDEINFTYSSGEREHFAIMPDVIELEKKFWKENYGITIISYDTISDSSNQPHKNLLLLLKEIQQKKEEMIHDGQSSIVGRSFTINKNALIRYCEDIEYRYLNISNYDFDIHVENLADNCKESHFPGYRKKTDYYESINFLNQSDNVILIGKPGSGKSFTIKKYSAKLAKNAISILKAQSTNSFSKLHRKIPLVLSMREYQGDIKEMIITRSLKSIDINAALEAGIFIFFFDGINEISRDLIERKIFEPDIQLLINKYPKNRFIFSSRSKEYLSFLQFPIGELMPLHYTEIDSILKTNVDTVSTNLPDNIQNILRNPFFLILYINFIRDKAEKINNLVSLLSQYFIQLEKGIVGKNLLKEGELMQILPPIAFKIIEDGVQTIPIGEICAIIDNTIKEKEIKISLTSTEISRNLIIDGILIPDSNGDIGFYHQTFLEYLAANELVIRFRQDSSIINNKINLLRWDETIVLFVGLLHKEESKIIINQIVKNDIIFACKAFSISINQDEEFGEFLFTFIIEKLANESLTKIEKQQLVNGLKYVSQFGPSNKIAIFLNDLDIADEVAPIIGLLHYQESIPKLFELLARDNCWPSEYAKALSSLLDETYIPKLLQLYSNTRKDEMLDSNIITILENFKHNSVFLKEIQRLLNSSDSKEKTIGIKLLPCLDSDLRNSYFESILLNENEKFLHELLFVNILYFETIVPLNENIENKLFKLLKNKKLGFYAAEILIKYNDEKIRGISEEKLRKTKNDIEKINLCAIIAKSNYRLSKKVIFEYIHNLKQKKIDNLPQVIREFNKDDIIPDLMPLLLDESEDTIIFVVECLRLNAGYNEIIPIDQEICESLIEVMENQLKKPINESFFASYTIAIFLTKNCTTVSLSYLLTRFNQPEYLYRKFLLMFLSDIPLKKDDLSEETIQWLISNLVHPCDEHTLLNWNDVTRLLGNIFDEEDITQRLSPLLSTTNKTLKNNIIKTILNVENRLGKRLLNT